MSTAFCRSPTCWTTTLKRYGTLRHISYGKGTKLQFNDVLKQDSDSLLDNLKSAKSSMGVLEIVHHNHKKMNEKQSISALKAIFALQKEGKSSLSTDRLIKHPDFERICKNIKNRAGIIEVNDAIETLKMVSYVGISSQSTIVQVMLQIVRSNVNFLNVPQILFMDFLLNDFEKTPLVEALQIALPLVLDINLKTKLNDTNPVQMVDCLQYAIKSKLSSSTVRYLVDKLADYPEEFDARLSIRILNLISRLPRNEAYKQLVNKTATDLVVNIDDVAIIKMEICLNRLAHKYSNRCPFYYQEVLFDTCANYIIDHNIGYKRAVGVLRNMARIHHFHKGLIDYVSKYIYDNPSTEKDPCDIYSIVVYMVLTEYRPPHWDHLKDWIKGGKNFAAENRNEIIWIRFAAALCVLDIYKLDVLIRSLNETYIKHLLEKKFHSNYEQYFAIWQCLTAYKPDLVELLPANFPPETLMDIFSKGPDGYVLEGALQAALGGPDYVLTGLDSKLGVHIDHAVVFSNGVPVPLKNRDVKWVEDIPLENTGQQLVLIWGGAPEYYTINLNTLRMLPVKALSILEERLKCHVIPVNLKNWQELNDFEKVPYLLRQIKEKLNLDIDIMENVL